MGHTCTVEAGVAGRGLGNCGRVVWQGRSTSASTTVGVAVVTMHPRARDCGRERVPSERVVGTTGGTIRGNRRNAGEEVSQGGSEGLGVD